VASGLTTTKATTTVAKRPCHSSAGVAADADVAASVAY